MGNIKTGGGLTGYYVVDRQRSLHVDNFPKKVTQASVQELFEELLQSKGGNFLSRAGGTRRTSLVTYVLLRSEEDGKTHAWIEFSTEALADLALNLCKIHPDALKIGRTSLAVQRPKGYVTKASPAGGLSLGSLNALNANGGAAQTDTMASFLNSIAQQMNGNPNTAGNTNNKDYVIDRKRALYAEGAPFDATGQEICRLFEGLLKAGGVEKVSGLVTHVIFARRCCAWVEFLTEEVADYALQQCHLHPDSLKLGKNILSVRRAYEVVRLLREEQENAVIPKGVFDWDYSVDRGRAVVAKNLPDSTSGPGIYHLFRNILLQSGKVDTGAVELVTHVIWQPGKSFALVEFGSDALADLAFQLCKMKPESVRLAQHRLLVERPAGPKPNGTLSPGSNGSDMGLHVTVPTSPSGSMASPVSGGLAQQLAQQGLAPSPNGTKKSALPRDIFSLSYSIDRQRALHVDALPDEEEGPGIRAMFEKLCLERGLTGGETGLAAAIAHIVRPPGRTFAWVEFNTAQVADSILDIFAQDPDAVKLGGASGHRVIVQRPKGYKAGGGSPSGPNLKPSPMSIHSPSFDEDSFPSLPSSGKSESFLAASLKSEAGSFAAAAAAAARARGGGFAAAALPPPGFHPDTFPVLRLGAHHSDNNGVSNGDLHRGGGSYGGPEDGFRLLSRHASFSSGRPGSFPSSARARLDAFSSLTVPEAPGNGHVSNDDMFAPFNLGSAVDRLLEDSAFSKPARYPSGGNGSSGGNGLEHQNRHSGRTSGSASPAYGAISPPLAPIGPTTRPSSASSNQSAFGWGSEADQLTITGLTLEPPVANASPFSGASSEASPFATSYFHSPAFSAASPFSLTPREPSIMQSSAVGGPVLSRQLSGGSSNFSLYSSSPVESIWGPGGNSGGWGNFGTESTGHGLHGARKGAFESVDRWEMAAGSFITG